MPQVIMKPQPQINEVKQKYIEEKAKSVVKALKGVPIADIGLVFNTAQQMIMKKCKV
ncbi:MAG: hypothetical protein ACTSUF_03420 [Candidatus Heimdallarchaeaceae archaeon]